MLLLFNASLNHTYRAAKKLKLYACVSNCVEIQGIYNSAKIILICISQITARRTTLSSLDPQVTRPPDQIIHCHNPSPDIILL